MISKDKISSESKIFLVDDGSSDNTWKIICELHQVNRLFGEIKLSRNRGHQNALLAGLMTVKEYADAVISMDADLQDDIHAIDEMIDKFYKLMNWLGAKTVFNHADFRLMSKCALDELEKFEEVNLFLRGLVPMIGYKTEMVYYERSKRFAGESKYPLKKMIALAVEGVTSLSIKPIKLVISVGITIFMVSIVATLYCLYRHFTGNTV